MAFNPFAGFAKYKRFWMAVTLILVMITFVLCTGKGDMGDKLMHWFQFGRTAMFRIDGTNYYRSDFDKIQLQRKVANDFMSAYSRMISEAIQERLRRPADNKEGSDKESFTRLAHVQKLFAARKQAGKFFEGPFPAEKNASKVDEVIDYRTWLAEADRLGISLSPKSVLELIRTDMLWMAVAREVPVHEIEQRAFYEVMRNAGERVNDDFIAKALENEYRVRIAQLADVEFQLRTASAQLSPIKRVSARLDIRAEDIRLPLSPGNLWDYFQANRKVFDVALMPVPVAEFAAEIPEPDARKLQEFFEKYKKTPYDPASPQPGFLKSHQIKVQYVTADQNAPFYKKIVNVADVLTQYPIGSFAPQMPLATALTFAAGPSMFDLMLERHYIAQFNSNSRFRMEHIGDTSLSDPRDALIAHRANVKTTPFAVAGAIGAGAQYVGGAAAATELLANASIDQKQLVENGLKADVRTLAPLYATVVASGTMPPGILCAAELRVLSQNWRPLPFGVVRPEIVREFDLKLASKLAMANVALFKKELDVPHRVGEPAQVNRLLERYGPRKPGAAADSEFRDLGLEVAQTDKFYDRYTIKDAPELKPLLEAFQTYYTVVNQAEGRDMFGKGQKSDRARGEPLKDDEFWRLFFDAETFSTQKAYEAKPWPPIIKLGTPEQIEVMMEIAKHQGDQLPGSPSDYREMKRQAETAEANKDVAFNLFATAERPFLFWKTEEKKSAVPDSLDEVKDRVAQAYKLQQARDTKVLPYVKKVAEGMLAGKAAYKQSMQLEKFGKDIVTFNNLAPIYRDMRGQYGEFKLKRDDLRYPREDMVAQMLSLVDLKEPIKISVAGSPETAFLALDNLNDELFKFGVKNDRRKDRMVQILTNKPRDTLYVAVVDANHGPNTIEFYDDILPGAGQFQNTFFDRALDKLGEDHYRAMVRQLREDHRAKALEDAKKVDDGGQ